MDRLVRYSIWVALLLGCSDLPEPTALRFTCQDDSSCAAGYLCDDFQKACLPLAKACRLYVTPGAKVAGADGSADRPFPLIQNAVDSAVDDCAIYVGEGTYEEALTVSARRGKLLVTGEHATEPPVIQVPKDKEDGILVEADHVSLIRLSIQGGAHGVHFRGKSNRQLEGGHAQSITIDGMDAAPTTPGLDSAGVLLEYTNGTKVSSATISRVRAAVGKNFSFCLSDLDAERCVRDRSSCSCGTNPGRTGAGILIAHSTGCSAMDNSISNVVGGPGGIASGWNQTGGAGGIGAGVLLLSTSTCTIKGNVISNVRGGDGFGKGDSFINGGTGGVGAGIYLLAAGGGAQANRIASNTITQVAGGIGGPAKRLNGELEAEGSTQEGFGVYVGKEAVENYFDRNTIDGEGIVYIYDATPNSSVELDSLEKEVNPTNLGKVVVVKSPGLKLKAAAIANYRGEAGQAGEYYRHPKYGVGGFPGLPGVGIRLIQCTDCSVTGFEIRKITGGRGGSGPNGFTGGVGGDAIGVYLQGCKNTTVDGKVDLPTLAGGKQGYYTQGKDGQVIEKKEE
ncbi:MAG: hypothetical protein HY698_15535 [Deltaproteobacteria bacterium]|nr:hypothetical protein [Deltaproteobacteria bacterium]